MDAAILIGIIAASLVLIIISFFVGQKTVTHQEQLNNDEVLWQRQAIEKDIQDKQVWINQIEREYQSKKQLIEDAQQSAQKAYDEKIKALDVEYKRRANQQNSEYESFVQVLEDEKKQVQKELDSLKRTRDAAIEAARKEREVQEQPDKYCIPMADDEIHDVEYLNNIMPKLKFPEVLGKCIWSVFFQKKMKAFLSGILGQDEVCGIYKITDQLTQECYVGQSKSIKKRWTDHIKCGLGAMPASNANQLYAAMRRDGVWNFSFELLESCSPEDLDAKERQFIDLYSADTVGLNSKRGNQSNTLKG